MTSFGWDIIGGASAGMKMVFLNEKEQPPYSFSAKADLICKNIQSLAEHITGLSTTGVDTRKTGHR